MGGCSINSAANKKMSMSNSAGVRVLRFGDVLQAEAVLKGGNSQKSALS